MLHKHDKQKARRSEQRWSQLPRTYTVLHNINGQHLLDLFLQARLDDFSLPYSEMNLPGFIADKRLRRQFLAFQPYILTRAQPLESHDANHLHLEGSGNEYFHFVENLGQGGFG